MRKISLKNATEEQIENAVRRNPDKFGIKMTLDLDESMEEHMNDWKWRTIFEEAVHMYPEDYHSDEITDADGCVDYELEKTREIFKEYIESFGEETIYVEVEKDYFGDVVIECVDTFSNDCIGDDRERVKFVGEELEMEIEVEGDEDED